MGPESRPEDRGHQVIQFRWGVVGLLAPITAYIFAYAVLLGHAHQYGIPYSFVTVSLSDVLGVTITLGGLLLILLWGVSWVLEGVNLHRGLKLLFGPALTVAIVGGILYWSEGSRLILEVWLGLSALLFAIALFDLLLFRLDRHTLSDSLDSFVARLEPSDPIKVSASRVVDSALALKPRAVTLALVFVTIAAIGGIAFGSGLARTKTEYLVAEGRPTEVVLLVSNGHAILGALDSTSQSLVGSYEVVSLAELGALRLTETGRLKPLH